MKKQKNLEDISVTNSQPIIELDELPDYLKAKDKYPFKEKRTNSIRDLSMNAGGDKVFWVSRYSLPNGVGWRAIGVKYNNSKRVEIDYNLPFGEDSHTYHHEEAHSLGTRNERAANEYANAA